MKLRTKKKRKQLSYVEGLRRGNEYLKQAMERQADLLTTETKFWKARYELAEKLLHQYVLDNGFALEASLKLDRERLDRYDFRYNIDEEKHTCMITATEKKEQA